MRETSLNIKSGEVYGMGWEETRVLGKMSNRRKLNGSKDIGIIKQWPVTLEFEKTIGNKYSIK